MTAREPAAGEPAVARATFASRLGAVVTLVGVATGLGNVWRFPYMVGKFGGAAFVLVYVVIVVAIGIPGLMAEYALGRHTRRGPVGAFTVGGLPFGREVGWFFFFIVTAATAYYVAVIGWVVYYAFAELMVPLGVSVTASDVLPPESGFVARSFWLQAACTALVILSCAIVLVRGLRRGIERVSLVILPLLLVILVVLLARALTLDGAMPGVQWYILKFRLQDVTAGVVMAALGQAIFSLSLGGTFMVVYGSYLGEREDLRGAAAWTAFGDTASGLLAGLAIFPAVFALGLEPASGPGLIFATLPRVFEGIPLGWVFGLLFFLGLFGAGYLSAIAAYEVLVAGLTDNTRLSRTRAVWAVSLATLVLSLPPSVNNRVFVPWDLTFGSGMQTLGSLLAVLTLGWCVNRAAALEELGTHGAYPVPRWTIAWIRWGIPAAILSVGAWWLVTEVFRAATAP